MKHQKEIVIGLSLILIVIEVTTVAIPLIEQKIYKNDSQTSNFNGTRNLTTQSRESEIIKEEDPIWSLGANHILGMTVCIICNILVMLGIHFKTPYLMLPWLIIYIIGNSSF